MAVAVVVEEEEEEEEKEVWEEVPDPAGFCPIRPLSREGARGRCRIL
jgi:hypothetical protein